MPWRERLERMRASGELDTPPKDLPEVPPPTYVQEENAKIEKRLREFRAEQQEAKNIVDQMQAYLDYQDKHDCPECGAGKPEGCSFVACTLGKGLRKTREEYLRKNSLAEWNRLWQSTRDHGAVA